jgi:PST family polysaccharide transporter
VFWASVRTWGVQLGTLLLFLVLARILGPRDFGLVALATVYLDLSDRLIDQGFASAIVQRRVLDDEHLDSAFWMSMAVAVVAMVCTFFVAPVAARLTHQPQLTSVLRVLSLTMLFTAMVSVQDGILRRRMAFRSLAMRGLASVIVGGLVGVGMAVAGYGVWSLVGQQLAWELSAIVVMWRATGWRPGFRVSKVRLKELWSIGAPITGTRLLETGQRRASDFIIGATLGPTALGFFAVGQRMATSLSRMMVDSIVQVAFPAFAQLQDNAERLRQAYYKATQYSAAIAFPAFLGLAALAPEFIAAWFGPRWLPSVRVSQILAILGLTWMTWSFNGAVLQALGAVRVQFWLRMFSTLTNLGAIIIGLRWGINGVAYAMLLRAIIFAPIGAAVVRHHVKMDYAIVTRRVMPPFAGAMAAVLAVVLVRFLVGSARPVAILFLGASVGAAVHVGVIRLLAPELIGEVWDLVRRQRELRRPPVAAGNPVSPVAPEA